MEELLKPGPHSVHGTSREQGQGGGRPWPEHTQLYVTPLGSLTTSQREFEALHAVHRLPPHVLEALLNPCAELFPDYARADPPDLSSVFSPAFTNYLQSSFNEPQLRAIHWAAAHSASSGDAPGASADAWEEGGGRGRAEAQASGGAAGPSRERHDGLHSAPVAAAVRKGQWEDDTRAWPFTLVQGPPGTGKTHTVWGMLNVIHLVHYQQHYSALLKYVEEQSKVLAVAGPAAGLEARSSAPPPAPAPAKAASKGAASAEAPSGAQGESSNAGENGTIKQVSSQASGAAGASVLSGSSQGTMQEESKGPCKKSRTPRPNGKAASGGWRAPADADHSDRAGMTGRGNSSLGPSRDAGAGKEEDRGDEGSVKRGPHVVSGQRGSSKGSEVPGQKGPSRPVSRTFSSERASGRQDVEPPAKKARTTAKESEGTGISDLLQSMQEQVLAPAAAAASRGRGRGNQVAGWQGGVRLGAGSRDAGLEGVLQDVHKPRMLVCAPSNAAVDELLTRVLDKGFLDGELRVYRPDVARIGADASSPAAQVCAKATCSGSRLYSGPCVCEAPGAAEVAAHACRHLLHCAVLVPAGCVCGAPYRGAAGHASRGRVWSLADPPRQAATAALGGGHSHAHPAAAQRVRGPEGW